MDRSGGGVMGDRVAAITGRCDPGMGPSPAGGVIADGIAARTGNCTVGNNTCTTAVCNNPNMYPNYFLTDKRLVNLFIVPYAALKGLQADDGVPITDFGKFYVTGWGGNGANADLCPGDDKFNPDGDLLGNGEIVGYFVESVSSNTGPTDPNITCVIGQIRPCEAVLVR